MTWLVVGGAGYIGGHVVHDLVSAGQDVVVVDDLSTGHADRLPAEVPLIQQSALDVAALTRVMRDRGVTGVVHLAARKAVTESFELPLLYYRENAESVACVLRACVEAGVRRVVYSSTAAVYGSAVDGRVTETTPKVPESPYGRSKLAGEWILADTARAHGLSTLALRYFNVVGAASAKLRDTGEVNLMSVVLAATQADRLVPVFGSDYPTADGTCVRDYIHVADVSKAHLAAIRALERGQPGFDVYNIGRGEGGSVLEVLDMVGRVSGVRVRYELMDRRPGEVAAVVADPSRIRRELGWVAQHDLRAMVASAWDATASA